MTRDLWPPDIAETDLVTPVSILREQAAALGPKTKNVVTAEVHSEAAPGGSFVHGFYLVAPALKYRYQLFTLQHPITLYPATAHPTSGPAKILKSETELLEWLQGILTAESTKSIIRALVAQSRE